ncbi:MAG: right-handed parallel beta-helix repeat-containing protein [Saprospiraceae bacterium]|nr:right-handed parallel beta-helix repeat-containing protein [Saprospiraceae bacterium]
MTTIYNSARFIIILILGLFSLAMQGQTFLTFEAEEGTLLGNATVVNCSNASNNKMVNGINTGGTSNAIRLDGIQIPEAGTYFITLSYIAVNDPSIQYQVNGNATQSVEATASGLWCYQGGGPADVTFEEELQEGDNTFLFFNSPIIDKVTISSALNRQAATFYLSSSDGEDNNDGLSPDSPWKSFSKINALNLIPGDSILLKRGDTFVGQLALRNESGTIDQPIVITTYGTGERPVLDGDGYLSSLYIQNSGYLHLSGLELKNDGGPARDGEPTNLRYGLYLNNTLTDGTIFEHFRIDDVVFRNIYPTEDITDDDQTGVHAYGLNTSGSWGDELNPSRFTDMVVENCLFTRTGRHALRILATDNLRIRNNLFEHVGGAGMVIGANSSNILVEGNTTNYTGSNLDPRMAARGSGIWCFRTKNLVVQNNRFMHARGIKDSFGMHIDIGNQNVVYQYNYSEDNEGGFVEVLGDNRNVGYRYNISVGDGWRSRGTQLGRIFWVGGWSGTVNAPLASDSVFIYNNSVYVPEDIQPRIWIEAVTQNTRIYNNIVYAPNGLGQIFIKNDPSYNDFDHNLWFGDIETIDDEGEAYQGAGATTFDPLFMVNPVQLPEDFTLPASSPAIGQGKLIYKPNQPDLYFESHGGQDYFGNAVSPTDQPNIGAYGGMGIVSNTEGAVEDRFHIYPTILSAGQGIVIEPKTNTKAPLKEVLLINSVGTIISRLAAAKYQKVELQTTDIAAGMYFVYLIGKDWRRCRKVQILQN